MYRKSVGCVTILTIAVLILGSLAVCGCKKSETAPKASAPPTQKTPATQTVATNAQTTCPVTGKKIDKNIYADYQGKRVYFCCADCKAKFSADPAKYIKLLEDKGITLEKTPK